MTVICKCILKYLLISGMVLTGFAAAAEEQKVFFFDDFHDLTNWQPLVFPKIKKQTSYTVVTGADGSFLKAESNASASALISKRAFNVYEFPGLTWQWKIENVYASGDAEKKAGDDYPLRIYVTFAYDPKDAGFWERTKYQAAKLVYGSYPPDSTLNYIWANRHHRESIIANAYTGKSKMILLQTGSDKAGKWITEDVNITEDYRAAFGKNPPAVARLAIMNDADNTGEKSIAYLNYIKVYSRIK